MNDREIPMDPALFAAGLIYRAASKAANDTSINPTPIARDLAVRSARNGFNAALAEVLFMVEYFAGDEEIKTVESLKAHLIHEIKAMTPHNDK